MEIKTTDDKTIHGVHNNVGSDTIIIFSHGITGGKNEHYYINAEKYFEKQGIDTYRFSYYDRAKNSRQLSECSISIHTEDLNQVINHFNHKNKILIGHSLGCLVILKANLDNIKKIILWDPASKLQSPKYKNIIYSPQIEKYIAYWGKEVLMGKDMIDEWRKIDQKELISNVHIPYHFFFAGNYNKLDSWNFLNPSNYTVIPGATHEFTEKGVFDDLLEKTNKIIKN